jgi:hypothetical protein
MPTSKETSASTPKPRRWGRMLTGCLLALAMLAVLAAVGLFITLRAVEQRWERTLREALATATGDEIGFGDLQLGLSGTTLTEVYIQDTSGKPVLTARELHLAFNPWTQSRESLQVDAVRLDGVAVSLHRDDVRWGLPETSLALLMEHDLQELPWPELRVGVLEIAELELELRGPESSVAVSAPGLTTTGLVVTLEGEAGLSLGPVIIPELDLSAPEGETIAVSGLALEIAPFHPGDEVLTLGAVRVEGVSAELGSGGWKVPDAAATALEGAEGIPWPGVSLADLTVSTLQLAAGGGADRSTVNVGGVKLEPTTLTLGPAPALSWGPVSTGAVSLASSGGEVARIEHLYIAGGELDRSATQLSVSHVTAGPLRATLRKGERWFAVPAGTWAIFARSGAPGTWSGLRVGKVELDSLDADIIAPSGTLDVIATGAEAAGVGLNPSAARPWSVDSATLTALTATSQEETFATVASVQLSNGGTINIDGVELWTRLRKNRTIKLPPVVKDHAPSWIGGDLADSDAAWFGVDLSTLPWQPQRASLRNATIHLDDARNADPPLQWTVQLSSASMGPLSKGRIPISAVGTVADGSFEASGGLKSGGNATVNVAAKKVSLKALTPYVDDLLDAFGLKVKAGTVGGDLTLNLRGSKLKITGPARARRIELGGKSGMAGLANAALQAVTGERTRVDLELNVGGDLTEQSFSPFRLVLGAVVGDLVGEATDTIGTLLEGVEVETSTGGKKKKKKGNQSQGQQALESIASELQSALTSGNNSGSGNKKKSGSGGSKKKKK